MDKAGQTSSIALDQRLSKALESMSDAFIMVDHDWRFVYVNSEAERLLHCPRAEVLGTNIWDRFPEAVGGRYYQEYQRAVADQVAVAFEEYYPPLDLWTEIRAYPCEDGLAIYFIAINERKAAENAIETLAFYDKLTALPNRQLFLQYVDVALIAGRPGAVLLIDLDNFKSLNDTRGHEAGDTLLNEVASRLLAIAGKGDTVARFGGDEFALLLEAHGDAARYADRVAAAAQASFARGFDIGDSPHYSSASIGVALFDHASTSVDEVLKRADLAMYEAKAAGRNAVRVFQPQMEARLQARVALEADLRHALERQQFLLHYQPLADIDGSMTGAEALLRWQHPQRGLVAPGEFIPVAEDTGIILALGQWVLQTACQRLARWGAQAATRTLTMAVNVSALQFHGPGFVRQVQDVLAATGANPRCLKLELTESVLVQDVDDTIAKMHTLRALGVGFSLDDFGTGYSSLSSLHKLPLTQLKIDQSFIRDALGEQHGAVIARTILALGKALQLEVLAEGVETAAHLAFIAEAGCQAYQGYLFSRPLPDAELDTFLARTNCD